MAFCIGSTPYRRHNECFRWIPWLIWLLLSYLNKKKRKQIQCWCPIKNIKSYKTAYTARNYSVAYGCGTHLHMCCGCCCCCFCFCCSSLTHLPAHCLPLIIYYTSSCFLMSARAREATTNRPKGTDEWVRMTRQSRWRAAWRASWKAKQKPKHKKKKKNTKRRRSKCIS